MKFVILCDILLGPGFKMTKCFANVAKTAANTIDLYTRKDFKSSGIGFLYEK